MRISPVSGVTGSPTHDFSAQKVADCFAYSEAITKGRITVEPPPPLYNGHFFCLRGQITRTLTRSSTRATLFYRQGGRCGEVQLYIRATSLIIKSQRFTLCEFNEMQCINASRTILTHPL